MNDLIGQVVTIKGELYGGKIQSIVGIEVSPNSSLEGKCCIAHGILSLRQHKKGTSRAYDVGGQEVIVALPDPMPEGTFYVLQSTRDQDALGEPKLKK